MFGNTVKQNTSEVTNTLCNKKENILVMMSSKKMKHLDFSKGQKNNFFYDHGMDEYPLIAYIKPYIDQFIVDDTRVWLCLIK